MSQPTNCQIQNISSNTELQVKKDLVYFAEHNISFIEKMKSNKEFQNPKILQQTVEYFGIDGNGTQFDPSVFNPTGYPPEDHISNF